MLFYVWDLKSIILVLFFWGVWHGLMQTYGFCRIYDAKMGSFAAISRRLDFLTCLVWFGAAIALSDPRMNETLRAFYASGGPQIPTWLLQMGRHALLGAAIAVSIAFVITFAWMWTHGKRQNPVKVALLVTSIAFWWYCNNNVVNILVGIALFEVFHDVQYLSLVWIYNRNRVEKDRSIGGFMRFVFRRSGALVGLYVGLVFAYGAFAYCNNQLQIENLKRLLTGVLAASALLHFYYDGFIWKVRESSTRSSLGLTGGSADVSSTGILPGWMLHGLKWVAAFIIPVGLLCMWQIRGTAPELTRLAWVVENLPSGAEPHFTYATALEREEKLDEAAEQYRLGLKLDPKAGPAHHLLGKVLLEQSNLNEAEVHLTKAIQLEPRNTQAHFDYGRVLARMGRRQEAAEMFQSAIRLEPKSAPAKFHYGAFLANQGKTDEAMTQYQRAIEADPAYFEARWTLGLARASRGDFGEAKTHLAEAVRLKPDRADVRNDLGAAYASLGEMSQAIVQFEEALRLRPGFENARTNLAVARSPDSRFAPQPKP